MPVRLIIEGNAVYEIDEDCLGSLKGKVCIENKRNDGRRLKDMEEKESGEPEEECSLI